MYKGVIDFITDLQELKGKFNYTVLVLGEYLNIPLIPGVNITQASILLPPYTAAALQLDGDINLFKHEYINHLQSADVRRYFAILLLGLIQGKNFALYVEKDEAALPFTNVLLEFLTEYYGIAPGITDSIGYIPCQYNLAIPNGAMLLYENNLINPNTFLSVYPKLIPIPLPFVQKLMMEFGMNYPNWSMYDYGNYFNSLKDGATNNIRIASPIVELGDNEC